MLDESTLSAAITPVSPEAEAHAPAGPASGIALCLSGGGYRAMLFHLGTLWRLNAAGILPKLQRVSSVSGGSITAGVLGVNWGSLAFDANGVAANFVEQIVVPLRNLADTTIFDRTSVWTTGLSLLGGLFNHDQVIDAYRDHLFGNKTLQDLPGDQDNDHIPRFVFNATNLMSGSLWRFSKPYMADWRVGRVEHPDIELAVAVAASSAFPIGLPPVHLKLDPAAVNNMPGTTLHVAPYTEEAVLVDGGVYDNMGIETAWKAYRTILVSDAGGLTSPQPHPALGGRDPERVLTIIDNQVGSLRLRQVIGSYQLDPKSPEYREGAYWGIGTNIENYGLAPDAHLPCPFDRTLQLAQVGTVLQHLDAGLQERLINWGYAVTDAALRAHVQPELPLPAAFPYPGAGV